MFYFSRFSLPISSSKKQVSTLTRQLLFSLSWFQASYQFSQLKLSSTEPDTYFSLFTFRDPTPSRTSLQKRSQQRKVSIFVIKALHDPSRQMFYIFFSFRFLPWKLICVFFSICIFRGLEENKIPKTYPSTRLLQVDGIKFPKSFIKHKVFFSIKVQKPWGGIRCNQLTLLLFIDFSDWP